MRISVVVLIVAALLTGSQEPWLGTWQVNLAKSSAEGNVRFKRATTKIEGWRDGIKVTYDLVGIRGGLTHMEWTGKFDGKDYPVQGVDYVLTNAYSPVDDHSYTIVTKVDGAITSTARVVISTDGKTLTTVTTGKDAQGNAVQTTTVYDRL